MAASVSKIYTRRGDQGMTRLLSGERVSKDDPRPKAYGAVDELQSCLGLARALILQPEVRSILYDVQQDLFSAGAALASSHNSAIGRSREIGKTDIAKLENWIDDTTAVCGLPNHFVIPGNTADSAAVHVARAVCRRCERLIVMLNHNHDHFTPLVGYFNRLSDLLFVLAWRLEFDALVEAVIQRLKVQNKEQKQ